jgi:hypothetical protein
MGDDGTTPNRPDVVVEVHEFFERYDQARVDKNAEESICVDCCRAPIGYEQRIRSLTKPAIRAPAR